MAEEKKRVGAGFGVILERDGKILMGRRHPDPDKADSAFRSAGEWSLPGGKHDWGESLEEGAIREVKEETGIKDLKLGSLLTVTYHTYQEGTRLMLKESHWFMMKAKSKQLLLPQIEEDIDIVRWAPQEEIPVYLLNSYSSVTDVLQIAMKKLK